ncbi:hypothetical protein [Novosphingobium sp. BL-8A]|uniref:hypothetical protein n=1 Tax=Novosphingobium sp. BL-8A TaxID=3127639 RepID=UPI003756C5D2
MENLTDRVRRQKLAAEQQAKFGFSPAPDAASGTFRPFRPRAVNGSFAGVRWSKIGIYF